MQTQEWSVEKKSWIVCFKRWLIRLLYPHASHILVSKATFEMATEWMNVKMRLQLCYCDISKRRFHANEKWRSAFELAVVISVMQSLLELKLFAYFHPKVNLILVIFNSAFCPLKLQWEVCVKLLQWLHCSPITDVKIHKWKLKSAL